MTKKERQEYMRGLGKRGGAATRKKYGINHFKEIGAKGQKALQKKKKSDSVSGKEVIK